MKDTMKKTACAVVVLLIAAMMMHGQEYATNLDYAQVREVQTSRGRNGTWRFDVTVEHNDTGWDHYADAWRVLNEETGEVLGERTLLHPHVNEMPFTRSLTVEIPEGVTTVRVRAKCNVHGYGGREVVIELQ